MKILELFGGIGACSKALERIGIDYEIADYVEIDKYAVASYNAIHNTDFKPQDIREWDKNIDVDLIMHGSPCQDFSVAGKGKGGDEGSGTRSSLMYETIRIVNKLKPKYVIWENVKNLLSKKHKHNFDKYVSIMSEGGYNSYYQVLNAKDYGIPQNRERVFTISIRQDIDTGYTFPEKQELKLKLKDMLENNVDEKYYLSAKWHYTLDNEQKHDSNEVAQIDNISYKAIRTITDTNKICRTIDTMGGGQREPKVIVEINNKRVRVGDNRKEIQDFPSVIQKCGDRGTNNYSVSKNTSYTIPANPMSDRGQKIVEKSLRIRKLTPKETWRLMGFDDSDFEKAEKVNSNSQLYKQAGNSIVVNVLERILENLLIKKQTEFIGQISLFERRI